MDFEAIKAAAQGYQADMTRFLREMISHPSESCEEKEVVHCIKAEMEKLGYDKVEIDGLGNVIGWMQPVFLPWHREKCGYTVFRCFRR